jgi:hypothetical protein
MYGIISPDANLPLANKASVTAGLKHPPDIDPPIKTATASAAPIAK